MPDTCPIERLIEHSAEHFIKPTGPAGASPAVESFTQLAQRRVANMVFVDRLLCTLAQAAPSVDQCEQVHLARVHLDRAIGQILAASKGGD